MWNIRLDTCSGPLRIWSCWKEKTNKQTNIVCESVFVYFIYFFIFVSFKTSLQVLVAFLRIVYSKTNCQMTENIDIALSDLVFFVWRDTTFSTTIKNKARKLRCRTWLDICFVKDLIFEKEKGTIMFERWLWL